MDNLFSILTSGLVGGFIGTFFGGFTKFFWERWLPERLTWQRDQTIKQRQLLAVNRDPAVRAISELQGRLWVIICTKASNYHYVKGQGNGQYYINSTAFVIAQYFAWSELMRRYIAALDYYELSQLLDNVSDAFARGEAGFQLFALEQREIGERLLETRKNDSETAIFCYAAFCDLLGTPTPPKVFTILQKRAKYLLDNFQEETARVTTIQNKLIDLLDFIDPKHRWVRDERRKRLPNCDDTQPRENIGKKTD